MPEKGKKLAIVTTHPIQYYVPIFQLLSKELPSGLRVFYTYSQRQFDFFDKDFGKEIKWDIPLLEGYNFSFVENKAKKPGLDHFNGIICPDLIHQIKKWGATHVLFFGWNYQAHLKAIRYFYNRIPVWFRGDSTLLDEKNTIKKLVRRSFLRWVYTYVDKAFYVGTNNKKYFIAHGFKENELIYTPHSIDNERFADSEIKNYNKKARIWRKQLGINDNERTILFCGKLEPKKSPELLLKAFFSLKEDYSIPNIKLIFVGNGILEKQLKDKSKGRDDIIFIPFQNQGNMPVVYRLGDIFCLPSKGPGETWGLVVNEAMASGLPVVASNKVGCAIDLIEEGKNGYIFNAKNYQDLTGKLNSCLNSDIKRMGFYAQRRIQKWSFGAIKCAILNEIN